MSKRKWAQGEPINSLEELTKADLIIVRGKTYNRSWFMSWPLRTVCEYIESGIVYTAIRIDSEAQDGLRQ